MKQAPMHLHGNRYHKSICNSTASEKKTLTFFAFCFEFFERFIPLFTSIVAHSKYQLHTRQ